MWYAANMKVNGGYLDAKEKASRMGLRLNVLRMRVTRARRALHRKIFLTTGDLSVNRQVGSIAVT